MQSFIIAIICFSFTWTALAQRPTTSEILNQEREHVRSLINVSTHQARLETAKAAVAMRKRQLDRIEKLYKEGHASQLDYLKHKMNYDKSVSYVEEVEASIRNERANAEFARLRLLEKDDPDLDVRKPLAQSMDDGWYASKEILEAQRKQIEIELKYLEFYYESGKKLAKKDHISEVELENRELAMIAARQRMFAIQSIIDSLNDVKKGAPRTSELVN